MCFFYMCSPPLPFKIKPVILYSNVFMKIFFPWKKLYFMNFFYQMSEISSIESRYSYLTLVESTVLLLTAFFLSLQKLQSIFCCHRMKINFKYRCMVYNSMLKFYNYEIIHSSNTSISYQFLMVIKDNIFLFSLWKW